MDSEALRNIRTMRQIKTGLVTGSQRLRTTNSLSKTKGEVEHLELLTDRRLEQIIEKEKRRFAAQEVSVNKSRERLLKSREKLAMTINKNRALNELRHELQRARCESKAPPPTKAKTSTAECGLRQIELKY